MTKNNVVGLNGKPIEAVDQPRALKSSDIEAIGFILPADDGEEIYVDDPEHIRMIFAFIYATGIPVRRFKHKN